MQPKETKNLLTYTTYLISPDKVVVTQRSQGREFMLADRFAPELIYIVTQRVDHESLASARGQPGQRLGAFTTHLEVRGRLHVIKSIPLLKSAV